MKMMKTTKTILALGLLAISFNSCKKCHECHYDDANDQAVELGEFCGDELEALEANGHTIGETTYVVHCHDEH